MKRTSFFRKVFFTSVFAVYFISAVFCRQEENNGVLLSFKFNKDDTSRIISTVDEYVYVNGVLNHKAKILNRIFSRVTEVAEDGSGTNEADFMTSETAVGGGSSFMWGEEYKSVFTRAPTGKYTIGSSYFMPTVRDVPVFPEYPVKPGDSWTYEGHEAHDLRASFNISEPFKVPFNARYEYTGDIYDVDTGRTLNLIDVEYDMYFESPKPQRITKELLNAPAVTMGHSSQKIYWDNEKGVIDHYSEEFRIIIETFYGDQLTFTGTAHAEVTEFQRIGTDENLRIISDCVSKLGYDGIAVSKDDRGVTISIENIQFLPDSSVLMDSEKVKLMKISEILGTFKNDLLVTGHCADRGTRKMQQKLSEDRAVSVADYLSLLLKNSNCIFTEGKGASVPAAPNTTEEGRARNRRVEITIMDK